MSVVVWDGKTLAADRQATNAGLRRRVSKMKQLADGTILAFVGKQDTGLALLKWYEEGHQADKFPASQKDKDDWSSMIVVQPNGTVFVYEQWGEPIETFDEYMAWGSGRDFAIGAMAMGADAKRAVEIASQFSTDCGMGVEAFEFAAPLSLVKIND